MDARRSLKRLTVLTAAVGIGSALFAGSAQAAHFYNLDSIFMASQGHASPYPSVIPVTGLSGTVSKVTVTASGLDGEGDNLQMAVVGPGGQATMLYRFACEDELDFGSLTFVFDDAAAAQLPETNCNQNGVFKPSDRSANGGVLSSPAPQGAAYSKALSIFNGTAPNGIWSLFAENTNVGATAIHGGWSIDIDTVPAAVVTKKKCKKKKHRSAESAKKKKCKKKKR
jgi:hypothetical protein